MTFPGGTLLVIEDEAPIRRFLKATLSSQGFRVVETDRGNEGLALAASHHPKLVLLDLGLPDMDGLDFLRRLRASDPVPVIILTARGSEQDKVKGLDAGADDYLTKPFGVGELSARIRAALRHAQRAKTGELPRLFESGGVKVDLEKRRVVARRKEVHLTPNEYDLLALLVNHAGKVVTQKQILAEMWGPGGGAQSLRTFIHQLREKLEEDPNRPKLLITEPGVGYRLKDQ